MEKWDILNSRGEPTGRRVTRNKRAVLRVGEYHSVVHIWIVDSSGNLLIQRRSDTKQLMPGEWAATGGAAVSGESAFNAARRELYEELSIRSNQKTLIKVATIKRRHSLLTVWVIKKDVPASILRLQKSEVAQVKWVTRARLEQMIENGEYHNYGKEYFDIVFSAIYGSKGIFSNQAVLKSTKAELKG